MRRFVEKSAAAPLALINIAFCVHRVAGEKKMSQEVTWVKVDSKSHPGRCYYYNRVSKASTWERPPELRDVEIPSHPAVVKGGKKVRSHPGSW